MAANGILEFQGTEKAIFRGSNSNIVIDTANSSFGVGVDTPTSNLHIVGKTSLQGDLNLVQVSNVANVTVNSNVVTEYTGPHDRPLRKYPEVALTQNDESATSGYVVEQTNTASHGNADAYAYRLFDHSLSTAYQSEAVYSGGNPTGSTQTTTATDGSTHQGVAITLDLVTKIRLSYAKITSHTYYGRTPVSGTFLGSNNNSTWDVIGTFSGLSTSASGQTHTVHIADYKTKSAYRYIRLIVTGVHPTQDSGTILEFKELEYYGHEEGSGSLDTTLKSVYNVPATTGTQLEVYYDAKNYSGSGDVQDETANNRDAEMNATFDNGEIKAFNFSGAYTSNVTTSDHGLGTGDVTYTMSYWFKRTAVAGSYDYIVMLGNGGVAYSSILMWINNDYLSLDHWNAALRVPEPIVLDQWYHVAAGHSGGNTPNLENDFIYINGKQVTPVITQTPSDFTLAGSKLTLGSEHNGTTEFLDGSIANFRLYSKALNADQVKELYDYQKDYFLGSKSQLTLYKGHLGVGVTEPSGQLELAGDERIQEYPPRGMTHSDGTAVASQTAGQSKNITYIEGHGEFKASASEWSYNGIGYDGQQPYNAFEDTAGRRWLIYENVGYNATTGAYEDNEYQLSASSGTPYGHWLKLEMPYAVNIRNYYMKANNTSHGAKDWQVWASNDDINWTHIHSYTNETSANSFAGSYYNVSHTGHYKMFAIIVTRIFDASTQDRIDIFRVKYFGTPGPTTLDKGSLTLGRSLDVPRISRYDVDTETPRPEKLVLDLDTTVNSSPTDISGQGNHGTFYNGASYSAADKAFNFNGGTNPGIMAAGPISITSGSGVFIHTISFWGWVKEWSQTLFLLDDTYPAGGSPDDTPHCVLDTNGNLRYDFWSNPVQVSNNPFPKNQWVHVGLVYKGGNVTSTSVEIYFNGVRQNVGTYSGNPYTSPSSVYLQLEGASSATANMKISNFKIYSVALEPSEVRKLYNLGRTGRSMVISDTAVGIGKVPEAQLDVRGNLRVGGTIQVPLIISHRFIYADTSVADANYIPFNGVIYENPSGSHTGNYFTCPIKGIYECHADILTDNGGTYNGNHEWYLNGTYLSVRRRGYSANAGGNYHRQATSHYYIECNSGDTLGIVSAGPQTWYGSSGYSHSHMSIRLITAT